MILASFLISFVLARVFTAFHPSAQLVIQGYHIHHFWYGLALLVIGGWLGINYRDDQTERIAAIVFGVGGGLVGDEVGLLLTFENYYSELTYTFVIALLAFAFMVALLRRHGRAILADLYGLFRVNIDFYVGLFLAIVSSAFLIQAESSLAIAVSGIAFICGLALILRAVTRYFKTLIR